MGRGQFQKAEMDIGSRPKLWDLRTTSRSSGSGSHVTGIDSAAGRGTNGMEMRSSGSGSGVGKFWSRLDADQEISWESIMVSRYGMEHIQFVRYNPGLADLPHSIT